MNDCTNCSLYCPIKLDLIAATDKLGFLIENWTDILQPECINDLSPKELKCTLCLIDTVIEALENDEYFCSNRNIIRLVNMGMLTQNTLYIHEFQNELAGLQTDIQKKKDNSIYGE